MTRGEILAFNAGVAAALDLARACSDALAPAAVHRVTRLGFAIGALDALVEEGRALMIEEPRAASGAAVVPPASLPLLQAPAGLVAASVVPDAPAAATGLARRQIEARARGYTGDLCSDCLNLTMVRNGTCLKCETCGSTSGCS